MPSPVGHALGGLIVALAVLPYRVASISRSALALVILAGVAPDVDFLWGRHNQETHSLGAALVAGAVVFAWKRQRWLAISVVLAWASHVLFDWLGSDTTPPLGVMALWPLSSEYYFANAFFFEAISRRYWLDNFVTHNLWAVTSEVLILGPVLLVVMRLRSRAQRRSRRPGTA